MLISDKSVQPVSHIKAEIFAQRPEKMRSTLLLTGLATLAISGIVAADQSLCEKIVCESGYSCVVDGDRAKCRRDAVVAQKCPQNETFLSCSSCESICKLGKEPCPKICGPPKCQCNEGYARNAEGNCVTFRDCFGPITCPEGSKPFGDGCVQYNDESNNCLTHGCNSPLVCVEVDYKMGKCLDIPCPPGSIKIKDGCREVHEEGDSCFSTGCMSPLVCMMYNSTYGTCVNGEDPEALKNFECGKNREAKLCTGCGPKCNYMNPVCPKQCFGAGCDCKEGYVLHGKDCVLPKDCPKECPAGTTLAPGGGCFEEKKNVCPENEYMDNCGNLCEATCTKSNPICPKICAPATCKCQDGFVRDEKTKGCVKQFECAQILPPLDRCAAVRCESGKKCVMKQVFCIRAPCPPLPTCVDANEAEQCAENETFFECASACEPVCGQNQTVACPALCLSGRCQCSIGFRRNAEGKCVKKEDCPSEKPEPLVCSANEIIDECGNRCEPTCRNSNPICPAICDPPACKCKPGLVRNPSTKECVERRQCPQVLPIDPCVVTDCPSGKKCIVNEVKCKRAPCPQVAECVDEESKKCGENESFRECASACEPTCGQNTTICTMQCLPARCQCALGFSRNSEGKCIFSTECPEVLPVDPCALVDCRDGQKCVLKEVQCIRAPCEPQPQCVDPEVEPSECPENEEMNQCGNRCEPSCKNSNPVCPFICDPPACTCKKGFVRDTVTGSNKCVQICAVN